MGKFIPDGPYDLTVEHARLRRRRDEVIPPDVASHMDQATAALVESKAADRAMDVGARAPGFTLPSTTTWENYRSP